MRAINHALTGAAIGFLIHEPLLAVPLAVGSHFALDALPHFGTNEPDEIGLRTKFFRNFLIIDAALCGVLVLGLVILGPGHWLLAAVCAFAAASPDFLSITRYRQVLSGRPVQYGRLTQWAQDIQWFERPIGGVVEFAWFIAALIIIRPFLR